MEPQLDALRLELAGALFDNVARQFEIFGQDPRLWKLTDRDAARLLTASQVVTWLAEEFRRCAIRLRATDELNAGMFRGQLPIPDDPAPFEASLKRPPPPPLPDPPISIDPARLDWPRERLTEARDVLRYGSGPTTRAAAEHAEHLRTWCGGY
jgi:hypothetical protein